MGGEPGKSELERPLPRIGWWSAAALVSVSVVLGFVVLGRYQQNDPTLDTWSTICRAIGITGPIVAMALAALTAGGCMIGPDYQQPATPVADQWLETGNPGVVTERQDYRDWWSVFNDPVLNQLINIAYQQNVSLMQAGARVLQAQAVQCGTALLTTPMSATRARENFDISPLPVEAFEAINRIQTRQRLNPVVKTGVPGFIPQGIDA